MTAPTGTTFENFFRAATRGVRAPTGSAPYDYQRRLACGERQAESAESDWLERGTECDSRLITIPTGLGKTAAVVLAWLWNRVVQNRQDWPRRLVYCLPMRTLVDQTEECVREWLGNLNERWGLPEDQLPEVHILMGGEDAKRNNATQWDLHPEKNAILIGTQDMLLSRALNRGYGMNRYRWPMNFGLLNNDCLWVMDETQLMGVGVETSAQLDGFRHGPVGTGSFTWWMSATLDSARLATVDHPQPEGGWPTLALGAADLNAQAVQKRVQSTKPLAMGPEALSLNAASKVGYAKALAEFIREKHSQGTFTLVVVNRVNRAQEIYRILRESKVPAAADIALIHSRFRPGDRAGQQAILGRSGDRIVIATQAIEAGVDISARLLITELAPWSSLVQRFGRCNRGGEMEDAKVFWIDIRPKDDKDELAWPYALDSLEKSRAALQTLENAGPSSVSEVCVAEKAIIRPVLRRKDLIDLFDTTPDLCGNDLDIGRYIRDGEDIDVQVYWRRLDGQAPSQAQEQAPARGELCRVPIQAFAKFLGKTIKAYAWNPLEEEWDVINHQRRPRPGGIYLLDIASGGYTPSLGWSGIAKLDPKDRLEALPSSDTGNERYGADRQSWIGTWLELEKHTAHVVEQAEILAEKLSLDSPFKEALQTAALWHDIGKAHPTFQDALAPQDRTKLWAKSENKGQSPRKGFRHELASALTWLQSAPVDADERDLVAYLVAAHHGKVRLSIRSLPGESAPPDNPNAGRFARGVCDGDRIPGASFDAIRLDDLTVSPVTLDLGYMELGADKQRGPSWLARTTALRDRLGPFRLAYLETLLRVADILTSATETRNTNP